MSDRYTSAIDICLSLLPVWLTAPVKATGWRKVLVKDKQIKHIHFSFTRIKCFNFITLLCTSLFIFTFFTQQRDLVQNENSHMLIFPLFLPFVKQDGNDDANDEDYSEHRTHDPDQAFFFIYNGLWIDVGKHHGIRIRTRRVQRLRENRKKIRRRQVRIFITSLRVSSHLKGF